MTRSLRLRYRCRRDEDPHRGGGGGRGILTRRRWPISSSSIDQLGFDSLWLSEVLTGPVPDPLVGLAWAGASNPRLKLGTTALLPGRNVLRLAKQLATLDVLSRGRLLVTLVPGLTYPPEREAIGVEPKHRGAVIDEAMPLLRRLWAGETVSHEGLLGRFTRREDQPGARAAAAGDVARRQCSFRAGALRAALGRLAAVPLHAGGGRRGPRGDRGGRGQGGARRSAPSTSA